MGEVLGHSQSTTEVPLSKVQPPQVLIAHQGQLTYSNTPLWYYYLPLLPLGAQLADWLTGQCN